MTIYIKPAEIVGAEVGDEVFYYDVFGEAKGAKIVDVAGNHAIRVKDDDGWIRDVPLHRLLNAGKEYKVGDRVEGNDYEQLPVGTIVQDLGMGRVYRKDKHGHWEMTGSEWNAANLAMSKNAAPREIVFLP